MSGLELPPFGVHFWGCVCGGVACIYTYMKGLIHAFIFSQWYNRNKIDVFMF